MLPCCQECSWVLMSADCDAPPSTWVRLIGHDCLWALKSALDRSLVLMNAHEHPWTRICMAPWCHEHSWAQMSGHEHSWVLIGNHDQSNALMRMVQRHSQHSWALKSTPGNIILTAPECQQVIMSAHECYWLLMSANGCSIVLMTAQVLDST